jgi:threonine/homoserine/homoserine lactone efflux protein
VIDPHRVAALAVTAFVLIAVPGPSVLFVISRGIVHGRRAGLATVVGNAAGLAVQVVGVALGLGALVSGSVAAFTVVKVAGAAYLVVLGINAIRHRRSLAGVLTSPAAVPLRRILREGFVVGVTNPKTLVLFTAVLPQFVDPAGAAPALQLLVLGALVVAIALVSDSVWAVTAGSARVWLARRPDRLAHVGGLGGVITVGLGVRLLLTGRND